MSEQKFILGRIPAEADGLLADSRAALTRYDLPVDALPNTMQPTDGRLKLVFVGQYSAGKSSLIKMLTGIDTGIGAAIKTTESASYDWNGLEIIDTPGIQTGVHPDHDEITYEAINHAALLVFVITNEGFNQTLGEHFIKLVREHNRGKNIVLVVNKMDRAMKGNSPEQQAVMLPDIEKVLGECGLTPDDVYLSFVSTAEYDEAQTEDDAELVADYLEQSGIEPLVAHLNAFTAARGIAARITTPLYTLVDALEQSREQRVGTRLLDGTEELLRRRLTVIRDAYDYARQDIATIVESCRDEIAGLGDSASAAIALGASESSVRAAIASCSQRAEKIIIEQANKAISRRFTELGEKVDKELQREAKSILFQEVSKEWQRVNISATNLAVVAEAGGGSAEPSDGSLRKAMMGASELFSIWNAPLKGYAGSIISADLVKTFASTVGFKFTPWGAIKLTKWLDALGPAWAIGRLIADMISSDNAKEEQREAMRQARADVCAQFSAQADEIAKQMEDVTQAKLTEVIQPAIEQCEQGLADIAGTRERTAACDAELAALIARANELITACGGDMATAAE